MSTPHPQAEILHALADGKTIQGKTAGGNYVDLRPNSVLASVLYGSGHDPGSLRVKPEPVKARFRVAEMRMPGMPGCNAYTTTADDESDAKRISTHSFFLRWLTDWVEYEVSE